MQGKKFFLPFQNKIEKFMYLGDFLIYFFDFLRIFYEFLRVFN
jgi:hypothetical protein